MLIKAPGCTRRIPHHSASQHSYNNEQLDTECVRGPGVRAIADKAIYLIPDHTTKCIQSSCRRHPIHQFIHVISSSLRLDISSRSALAPSRGDSMSSSWACARAFPFPGESNPSIRSTSLAGAGCTTISGLFTISVGGRCFGVFGKVWTSGLPLLQDVAADPVTDATWLIDAGMGPWSIGIASTCLPLGSRCVS